MKSLFIILLLILLTSCNPTNTPTEGTENTKPTEVTEQTEVTEPTKITEPTEITEVNGENLFVSDFFIKGENTKYSYKGEGNEFASYTVFIDYIHENKIQYRTNNGGTELAEVVEIDSKNALVKSLYLRGDFYYRDDFLRNPNIMLEKEKREEILLKEPIKKGNSWMLENGLKREITGINVDISVPYGKFKAVEVTTKGKGYEDIDYYAKGIGHIKYVFVLDNVETVVSSLEKVEKDIPLVQNIKFYFPNIDEEKYYYFPTEVNFKTNDITRNIIANNYKGFSSKDLNAKNLGTVFTKNTKINSMFLGKDKIVYLDLSKDFIKETNAGAGYEAMILQSIANTFGSYYGVDKLYLTIDGENYESGHILLGPGEYLKVDFNNTIEVK